MVLRPKLPADTISVNCVEFNLIIDDLSITT